MQMARAGRSRKQGKRHPGGRLVMPVSHMRADYLEALLGDCKAVYVMCGSSAAKIGISVDPARRVKCVQVGNHEKVRAPWYIWLQSADAYALERAIHREFQGTKYHSSGEWYWFDYETAVGVVNRKIKELGLRAWPESMFSGHDARGQ